MQKKVPFALRLIQFSFSTLQLLWPKLADRWAIHLFLSPRRVAYTAEGKSFLNRVETFQFQAGGKLLYGYKMGEGPEVICVHGWAGKATQFATIADRLVAEGYTFIAFDAWAHGQSAGSKASMFDFTAGYKTILERCHNPVAVIGHSLGAASVSLATYEGMHVPKFIPMGAPCISEDILDSFREIIHARPRVNRAIREACLEIFDREFDEVAMQHTFQSIQCPVLAIHGDQDVDVSIEHLNVLESMNPSIETMRVKGLGHRRILKDPKVIDRIVAFIA